jgi:Cu/Ag efflux pump CusA
VGRAATNYLLYVAPIIVLAIFALLYLELEERFPERSVVQVLPMSL